MPSHSPEQRSWRVGVDVGGTFTDCVASDGQTLILAKLPSTPPDFHLAVIEAVKTVAGADRVAEIIHGSTVATNALLQRTGELIAFVTTEGFGDLLLIGRQNRPSLYALRIERPQPLAAQEHCFALRERIDAAGNVVEPLEDSEIDRVAGEIHARGLKHAAVCLLFAFINPAHEQRVARKFRQSGLTVSLSSEVMPEFREYERASTTAINAALGPVVKRYLSALEPGLGTMLADQQNPPAPLRIMHSSGGTLTATAAGENAARLVLSGPAGGVMGAAFIAKLCGFPNVITYDMGGTSTDVAVIREGQPHWTTTSTVDGLPLGLSMFDIHTVGAGGGSIAYIDAGGALRVGPASAGAIPGPACYNRGGTLPTVTDANLLLGRIVPDAPLGGTLTVRPDLARQAIQTLAGKIGKSDIDTAIGVLRVAEANMERAIRRVTSRRGHDPRRFALMSFGGAGGLHACALAESLEIPRVIVPPFCGVLSALGMVAAPALVERSRTVVHLGEALDDNRLIAELGSINGETSDQLPYEQTAMVEVFADVRFRGQSYEVTVKVHRPSLEHVAEQFKSAYAALYGQLPSGRPVEIVTLRVRRTGHVPKVQLPPWPAHPLPENPKTTTLVDGSGQSRKAPIVSRHHLVDRVWPGPLVLLDTDATTYVPAGWQAEGFGSGAVLLTRAASGPPTI